MKYIIKMPVEVETAINILNNNGFEAYVVGGCVRDSILEVEPSDWDITTSAQPNDIIKCFDRYKVIETGIKHGTVSVIIDDMILEITTYRIDGEYKNNRRPESVQFTANIVNDLERRDFTINAMAYNYENGLIDLYGGVNDVHLKLIKCVGEPDKRFNEDGLRILRALRFASVLEFGIESSTATSIHKNKKLLTNISTERITVELNKLITGFNFKNILDEYRDVIVVFIPQLEGLFNYNTKNTPTEWDLWQYTLKIMSNSINDLHIRLALMLHAIGKPEHFIKDIENNSNNMDCAKRCSDISFNIMKNLKYDKDTTEIVKTLVLYHDADIQPTSRSVKRWLNKIGIENLRKLLLIKYAQIQVQENLKQEKLWELDKIKRVFMEILEKKQCYNLSGLAIDGTDLIKMGWSKGKHIGEVLNELLFLVIDEELENNKEVLINYVKNHKNHKKYLDKGKI